MTFDYLQDAKKALLAAVTYTPNPLDENLRRALGQEAAEVLRIVAALTEVLAAS